MSKIEARVKMQGMSEVIQPPRTLWGDFPDVLIHASETAVKQHPAYKAAKAGDDDAAMALVLDTFNPDSAQELGRIAGHSTPTLVSAHALERDGVNAIPEVFADPVGPVFELACGQRRYPGQRGLAYRRQWILEIGPSGRV